jgi:hypothetical protein
MKRCSMRQSLAEFLYFLQDAHLLGLRADADELVTACIFTQTERELEVVVAF